MRQTTGGFVRTFVFPLCLSALAANSWAEESTDPSAKAATKPPPGQLDNGLISLTKLAPTMTRVSKYSGDIWNRTTMLGDFDDFGGREGLRTELYNKGFSLDVQITQVLQGVASGGSVAGNGGAAYNGLLEINTYFDTAKLGLWSGGLLAATLQTSWGNPLSSEVGNISPVNMTPFWPVPFEDTTRLTEYYLTQGLPLDIVMILGRIDATNFLDTNKYANNPESQFLNASLNNDLLWGNMLTFSTYAALLVIPVNENFSVATGVWTPSTQPDDYGGDWSNWAAVINPILSYHVGGKAGKAQVTYAYSSADTTGFDNPYLGGNELTDIIIDGVDLPTKDNNWLVTFNLEQHLWTPQGKENYATGTEDFDNNPPGIGLFYRFGFMPDDRNSYNMTMSGGFGGRGVIPGRPNDRMGLGVYAMFASNHFKDASRLLDELLKNEVGFEAYYTIAITPWLQVSADAQYISQGISISEDSWVLGSRLNIRL